MELQTVWRFLNEGIASDALGGLTSTVIVSLLQKMKNYFSNPDKIEREEFDRLSASNSEFQELSTKLYQQVQHLQQNPKSESVGAVIYGATINGGIFAGKINRVYVKENKS